MPNVAGEHLNPIEFTGVFLKGVGELAAGALFVTAVAKGVAYGTSVVPTCIQHYREHKNALEAAHIDREGTYVIES